jgi:ABC-type phosphate transport system substrate-binding protein
MGKVLLLFMFITGLHAENMVFIANSGNPITKVDKAVLKKIYLKKRRFWKETKLNPLNLPPHTPLREAMEKQILGMSASALDAYWMKEHYRGHRPPYRVESVKSMLLFVKKVKGAIGYIPQSKLTSGVKVIYRLKTK